MEQIITHELPDQDQMISQFLEGLDLNELEESEKLVKVAQSVSAIPWGEGRTIEDVFTKGVGTCTGKHKVLQACFDKLGIEYQPVVCTFKWGDQPVDYPQELKDILAEGEWEHGHNFVQLKDGTDLDVTWNKALAEHGFKVLPEDWDGKTSFVGVDQIKNRWDGANIDEMKADLIGGLDEQTRERRERFLKGLIRWTEAINKGQYGQNSKS